MLHTKFQGHHLYGSREEDFLRFLPYMGMAAILVMWPGPFEQTFVPPSQGGYIWNLASIGPVVSEEKMFENVDIQHTHTHIRTTEAYLYYKLTNEPKGSGELIKLINILKCEQCENGYIKVFVGTVEICMHDASNVLDEPNFVPLWIWSISCQLLLLPNYSIFITVASWCLSAMMMKLFCFSISLS